MSVLLRPVEEIPGIGPRRGEAFRRLGLRCVADLVTHLPFRWERQIAGATIADADLRLGNVARSEEIVVLAGEIAAVRAPRGGGRPRFEAMLEDATGSVKLVWFNAPWMRGRLHPGARGRVAGRLERRGGALSMTNPRWSDVPLDDPAQADADLDRAIPVYPASEEISSAMIANAIGQVLEEALAEIEDHLPAAYRRDRALPELAACYRAMHRSDDADERGAARRRLAFDELLLLQLGVMMIRRHRRETLRASALPRTEAIERRIAARLPFRLTAGQAQVVEEIAADLARPVPMNRLLQGDVGAGKTAVALCSMLLAVAAGKQAALMAPTELLAEQHLLSLGALLTDSAVRIELLTGSMRAAERRRVLAAIESGEAHVVVGTHALLVEHVAFADLALAIVDEQHRFGVHQRATLRSKGGGEEVPHVLVMTATPIPRTLALTLFGDLDVSTIRDLPPGRSPIDTRVLPGSRIDEAHAGLAARVAAGEQGYVVVPVIDESTSGLVDVASRLESLRAGPLAGRRVAAVHGRMDRAEREETMQAFRAGSIDVLVATTVIEVGVDVPNATTMIIEHAERFGLAQLHQLRGRIGRGGKRSVCVLVADPTTDEGARRIEAIAATTDGFAIAEKDLEIRGPGELFGARQSGLAPFRVARIPDDLELLRLARRDAAAWIDADPRLAAPRDALLRRRLLKAHGAALGLGDVG